MSPELRIAFLPNGPDKLNLQIKGGTLPDMGKLVQREVLNLDPAIVERFRRRDLKPKEVSSVVKQVNDWLLDGELRAVIGGCLQPGNATRLRLIFELPDETRQTVANLPLELLWYETPDRPLVLRRDVASLSYLLPKVSQLADAPGSRTWPLKILIVRSNPPDLGGFVPEVTGLRDHIVNSAAAYGNGMVQVDVISSEPAISGRATWQQLRDHLKLTTDYNILVYLGHGELAPLFHDDELIGQLFMESEDGFGHQPISAPMVAKLLALHPIPVVVLTGCMTATQSNGSLAAGDQGVAQSLVNSSEAGVQVAVGMRIELEMEAATAFLKAFFTSLLSEDGAGDVDRAVWSGRNEIFAAKGPHPPQWAAPAVFRASLREPFIDFLTKKSEFLVTPQMEKLRDVRSKFWALLPQQNASQAPSDLFNQIEALLQQNEQELRAEGLKQGALLLPQLTTIAANGAGKLSIVLCGPLHPSLLRGRVSIGAGVGATKISMSKPARDAGFRLMADPEEPSVFELLSKTNTPTALPEGELVQVELTVGDLPPGLYPVTLSIDVLAPRAIVWPGDNVVVVPRP